MSLQTGEQHTQIPVVAVSGSSVMERTEVFVSNNATESIMTRNLGMMAFWFNPVNATAVLVATATKQTCEPLEKLRGVVHSISEGQSLQRTTGHAELVRRAVASRGTPADVKEWAKRLADDTGDLND